MSVSFSIGFLICPPVPFVIAVIGGCLNVWIFSPFSSAPVSMGCVLVVSGLSSGFSTPLVQQQVILSCQISDVTGDTSQVWWPRLSPVLS